MKNLNKCKSSKLYLLTELTYLGVEVFVRREHQISVGKALHHQLGSQIEDCPIGSGSWDFQIAVLIHGVWKQKLKILKHITSPNKKKNTFWKV